MAQIPCGFGWSNIAEGMTSARNSKLHPYLHPGAQNEHRVTISQCVRSEFSIPFKLFSKVPLLIANRSCSHVSTGMAPFCIRLSLAPTSVFTVPSWESTNMVILARWSLSNRDPLSLVVRAAYPPTSIRTLINSITRRRLTA